MNLEDLNGKRVMHIDTSCKLHENRNTGIAYKIVGSKKHKGLALKRTLKKELDKRLRISEDYAKLYAICIYFLINDDFDLFDVLVICGDEPIPKVKNHLKKFFEKDSEYFNKKVMSISELRKLTGNNKLRSYADGVARSYRRRALKNKAKQQEGVNLNIVRINYKIVEDLWKIK